MNRGFLPGREAILASGSPAASKGSVTTLNLALLLPGEMSVGDEVEGPLEFRLSPLLDVAMPLVEDCRGLPCERSDVRLEVDFLNFGILLIESISSAGRISLLFSRTSVREYL